MLSQSYKKNHAANRFCLKSCLLRDRVLCCMDYSSAASASAARTAAEAFLTLGASSP